jgi:hypothetical protein
MSRRTDVKVVGVVIPPGNGSLNYLENPSARDCGPKLLGKAKLLSNLSNAGPYLSIDGASRLLISLGLLRSDLTCPWNVDIDALDD